MAETQIRRREPARRTRSKRTAEDQVLGCLRAWEGSRALSDCPLPDLLREVRRTLPRLTIGQFHDALRLLHERRAIHLHPWTGPLYEMPEPSTALLCGHEIAYYASLVT